MSQNQTIDGVPRKSLEQALKLAAVFDDGGDGADAESARGVVWILRALLDAPAPRAEFKKIEMVHVMNALEDVRGKPVLTSNQCHDLARGLNDRLLSPLQLLAMPAEYLEAVQPPAVPVIHITPEVFAMLRGERKMQAGGLTYSQSKPLGNWTVPLYAEQPPPEALVLPERKQHVHQGLSHTDAEADGWNACLDEVARLTATVRIPERLVMTDGLHTYEYVTGHNAAIDKMLGVKS
ncbi:MULTISPECIES: hypothetical protein [Pseudomonas]|uniref:Uncharacterized protein n=1 Tax=Pseudomonas fluorescens TaxID=294 RepID=A0A2T0HMC0_PSEFL|nr:MULTISPECIES: hypothetical protein [Pseudomonas]PRW84216.1 hypothetical protein C7A10_29525 [Pseudomonas fluorescens]